MTFVYMLRCADGSLYTGYTDDLEKRYRAHCEKKGAKYTVSHPPVAIAGAWETETKSDALKLEYQIKRLSKEEKERIVKNGFPGEEFSMIPAKKIL